MEYTIKNYKVSRDEEATCPCGAEVAAGAKALEILDNYTVLHTAGLCSRACAEIEVERLRECDKDSIFNLAA